MQYLKKRRGAGFTAPELALSRALFNASEPKRNG